MQWNTIEQRRMWQHCVRLSFECKFRSLICIYLIVSLGGGSSACLSRFSYDSKIQWLSGSVQRMDKFWIGKNCTFTCTSAINRTHCMVLKFSISTLFIYSFADWKRKGKRHETEFMAERILDFHLSFLFLVAASMSISLISSILFAIMCRMFGSAILSFYAFARLDERCQMNSCIHHSYCFSVAQITASRHPTAKHFAFFAYHFPFIPFSGRETDPAGTQNSTRSMRFDVNKLILESVVHSSGAQNTVGNAKRAKGNMKSSSMCKPFYQFSRSSLYISIMCLCGSGCSKESHGAAELNGRRKSDGVEYRIHIGASKLFPIIFQFRFRLNSHSAVWIRPSIDFNAPKKCWMMRRRRTKEEKKKKLCTSCVSQQMFHSPSLCLCVRFLAVLSLFETSHRNERCPAETLNNVADEKVFRIVIGCTALCRRVCSQQQFISIVIASVIDEFDVFFLSPPTSARAPRRLSSATVILANATTKFDYNRSACDGISNAEKKVIGKRMCERRRVNDFRPATFCAESCGFNKKKRNRFDAQQREIERRLLEFHANKVVFVCVFCPDAARWWGVAVFYLR